jgi:protein-disulfide isomerase
VSKKSQQLRAERAAAALREQEARERRRRTLMIVGTLVAVLAVVIAGFLISRARDTTAEVKAEPAGTVEHGLAIGPADAPHEVVIYEDFLCPICGDLESRTHEQLAQLADEGKVRVDYRPFELLGRLGDYSKRSAAAFSVVLEKSGPQVAKRFHDLLYANQPDEAGPFPDDSELVALAVEAGADESEVADDIENGAGSAWVDEATKEALATGLQGTPTVLVDGKVFNAGRTMQQFAEQLLAAAAGE